MPNETDYRVTLRQKGYLRQPDGSYSLQPVAPAPQGAVLERALRSEPTRTPSLAQARTSPLYVRITGYYVKPLDDCNFCTKYLVDCLRYAGIITDDNWGNLRVEHEQFKVEKEENEGTLIEITPQTGRAAL